jgi:hypothetical protein
MPRLDYATCTRPDFEAATYLGSLALQHAVDYLGARGINLDDLKGDDAIRTKVLDSLARNDSIWFFGVGHGNCYSEDTEILTENGWKKFYELEAGEKVATLNPQTGELEYQVPTKYFKFVYRGKMLLINGKRVNLLVTPNHKLYVSWMGKQRKEWLPFKLIEAQNIGKKGVGRDAETERFVSTGTTTGCCLKFRRGAKWNCEAIETFRLPPVEVYCKVPHRGRLDEYVKVVPCRNVEIEDWLRFFGAWLAEGSASLGDRKGEYIISITQNNYEKRKMIRKWVDRVGEQVGFKAWEETSNEHSKCIKFKNKQVYEYLKKFGHAKEKFIPKEIKMLPPHLLRVLLEAMVFGDGYVNKRGEIQYSTASKRLADDVQEIAMKIGMGATISRYKRTGVYTVNISDDEVCVTKRSMKWVNYDGYVYCVEVPNHLLYVRRNSKPCWSGNSTTFTGQGYDKIFWTCDNVQLGGRVAFMLSCITAAELGPDSVNNKGAVCYMGYADTFSWTQERLQDPLADRYGISFFEPVLELIYRLADGATTGEAFKASLDKWNYWIDYWSRSTDPFAPAVLMLLLHDRDCQKLIGDETARVASAIPWPWWLLQMGFGLAPVGAVVAISGSEELRKMGVVGV